MDIVFGAATKTTENSLGSVFGANSFHTLWSTLVRVRFGCKNAWDFAVACGSFAENVS